MADDLTEKIKALMSDPETMNMLTSLVSSKRSSDSDITDISSDAGPVNGLSENLKLAMNSLNQENDRRVNLLKALQPYMRKNRASGIDKAIKMLKLTQITSLMKDL